MIQEFSVRNFLSIKDKQTLSFVANKKLESGAEEFLCFDVNESVKLLKLAILYGANASGKTNLLLALTFLNKLVVEGRETKEKKIGFVPFKFDHEIIQQPGEFNLIFYIDKIKYDYYVKVDSKRIYNEVLYFWPEGRKAIIYNRTSDRAKEISKISFGIKAELTANDKNIIKGNTLENNTVLYTYKKINIENKILKKVVSYFNEAFLPYAEPKSPLRHWSISQLLENSNGKDIILQLMKKADFQISEFEIKKNVEPVDEKTLQIIKILNEANENFNEEEYREIENNELYFQHKTSRGIFKLSSTEESEGTQRYFGLAGVLREIINFNHIITIDEIESSLHPDLVSFLLQAFLVNSQNSQMIVTTHAQYLMTLDYMRRDMIWFCEKAEDGSSQYFSAQDFKIHKNVRLDNFYRIGKLGAIPNLGSPFIED